MRIPSKPRWILVVGMALIFGCNENQHIYVPVHVERLGDTQFSVLVRNTQVGDELSTVMELNDDSQHIRIKHASTTVLQLNLANDSYFADFWATADYLYGRLVTYGPTEQRNTGHETIVRYDRAGEMQVCCDISVLQDDDHLLRFAGFEDKGSFKFYGQRNGNPVYFDVRVENCSPNPADPPPVQYTVSFPPGPTPLPCVSQISPHAEEITSQIAGLRLFRGNRESIALWLDGLRAIEEVPKLVAVLGCLRGLNAERPESDNRPNTIAANASLALVLLDPGSTERWDDLFEACLVKCYDYPECKEISDSHCAETLVAATDASGNSEHIRRLLMTRCSGIACSPLYGSFQFLLEDHTAEFLEAIQDFDLQFRSQILTQALYPDSKRLSDWSYDRLTKRLEILSTRPPLRENAELAADIIEIIRNRNGT